MKRAGWAWLVGLLVPQVAGATTAGAFYAGQSLLCRDQADGATCELWLDGGGSYTVFYDGRTPLGIEGRRGSYRSTAVANGVQLCLQPQDDPVPRVAAAGVALFHDAGCVVLPVHPIGEVFSLDYGGRRYSLVLAQGR